jgi:hypothetical protein
MASKCLRSFTLLTLVLVLVLVPMLLLALVLVPMSDGQGLWSGFVGAGYAVGGVWAKAGLHAAAALVLCGVLGCRALDAGAVSTY